MTQRPYFSTHPSLTPSPKRLLVSTLRFAFVGLMTLPLFAAAAAPVITSSNTAETAYNVEDRGTVMYSYRIVATGSPTNYGADGIPSYASFNTSTGVLLVNPSYPGDYDITLSATNADGTGTAPLHLVIHPAASGLSGSPSGTYTAGMVVTFTVAFNSPMTVTGSPSLTLSLGAGEREARYSGGSGSNTLNFSYTVAPGDIDTDGVAVVNTINLNGGAITDANGIDAATTIPTRSFSANIVLDGGQAAAPTASASDDRSRLINLSSRARVTPGDANRTFIAGFVVSGQGSKRMIVRAVGPALESFGLNGALSNPVLKVYDSKSQLIATNDDWSDLGGEFSRVGAFAFPAGSRDSALELDLAPGAYSMEVASAGGDGVALAEVYDASDDPVNAAQELVNISTRAYVGVGADALVAGFVVRGSTPKKLLIRGIGPGLTQFGVGGVLANPVVQVYRDADLVAQNDDWGTSQTVSGGVTVGTPSDTSAAASSAGGFALASGSSDAAMVITVPPGNYSAVVSGANSTTGVALVEVYELK